LKKKKVQAEKKEKWRERALNVKRYGEELHEGKGNPGGGGTSLSGHKEGRKRVR